jgi:nucleotide-binding universal stress UspA family protein
MNAKINTILVPIDATFQSVVALNQSYDLARLTNSKIVLMSVEEGKAGAHYRLESLASEARNRSGVPVEVIIRTGNVVDEIKTVADLLQPLFIVTGVISKDLKSGTAGKNAFKVIRQSKYPVIAIKGIMHRRSYRTIVLPLDFTRETREKVIKGVELAKTFGAQIHVVSVLTSSDEISGNKLAAYSHQVTDYIINKGVDVVLKTIISTDIAQSVLTYSRDVNADLIVIMSKYELNLIEYFIGTTADRLIGESDIPVLSIRPKAKKDTTVFLPY